MTNSNENLPLIQSRTKMPPVKEPMRHTYKERYRKLEIDFAKLQKKLQELTDELNANKL
jgi:hypothetical protein